MALTCDNCGSIIGEAEYITVPFDLTEDKIGSHTADDWYYYCAEGCAGVVRGLLENLRQFGHKRGESGLRWALVEAEEPASSDKGDLSDEQPSGDAKPKPKKESDWAIRFGELPPKLGVRKPPVDEVKKRLAEGTPLKHCIGHKVTRTHLLEAGLVTLEDVADLTEVEFVGVPGVGRKTVVSILAGFEEAGLKFTDGPTTAQLGQALRSRREEADLEVEEVAKAIAAAHGIQETVWADNEEKDVETVAWRDLCNNVSQAEYGQKPPMPIVLKLLAEQYGTTREGLLAAATDEAEALV